VGPARGGYIGPNAEVGFMYSQQLSTLQLGGTNTRDVGDLKISNYHGISPTTF
jgi:hypothetical protein